MLPAVSTPPPPPGTPPGPPTGAPVQLARLLGAADLALIAIGIVVGSGIFLVPGLVIGHAGLNPTLAISVWLVGGVLSYFGALTYGEMGAMRPEAGGIYVYIRDAFGPLPAFLYGWSAFFVIASGALATLAVAFTTYLSQLVPITPATSRILPVALIALLTVINAVGTRRSVTLLNVTTFAKVAGLVVLAVVLLARGDLTGQWTSTARTAATVSGYGTAMISVLWAYEGWQYVTCLAGEARDPQRTFPRGIGLATLAIVALYVLTNLGYIAALGPEAAAASTRVAADALEASVGPGSARLVSVLIVLSILTATNASVLSPSRIYFAMARDGVFFQRLGEVSPRFGTPLFAIVAGSAWAMVLAASGTFEQLLTYVVFAAWIFYGLAALSIFTYRRRLPQAHRPYRVPLYPLPPLLFVASAALLVLNTMVTQPGRAALGLTIVASGIPAYYWWRARTRTSSAAWPAPTLPRS